jgi:hypothetical protein
MKAEDFDDRFVKLAILLGTQGYVIVGYETNGTDISLRLVESEKNCEKPQEST